MRRNDVDVQVWGKEEPDLFSVNSAYECLAKQSRGTQSDVFNLLWKTKAFPNVIVTAWRVLLDRIPTRVSLSRRGVMMESRYVQCVSLRRSLVNISSWSVNMHNGYGPCASNG